MTKLTLFNKMLNLNEFLTNIMLRVYIIVSESGYISIKYIHVNLKK